MRAAVIVLLLASSTLAQASPEEARSAADVVYGDRGNGCRPEDERKVPDTDFDWLPARAGAAAERLVERLRDPSFRVRAGAFRFDHLPAPLEGLRDRASLVLTPGEIEGLRALARDGALEMVRHAVASGPAGLRLFGRDLEMRRAVLRHGMESAIGAVSVFPIPAAVRSGLWLTVEVGIVATQGVMLRYEVVLADPPHFETRSSVGGPIDYSSVPTLLAQGGVRLASGEAAAILHLEKDGSGRLVVLSIEGSAGRLAPVTHLGDGWVAALAGHLTTGPVAPVTGSAERFDLIPFWTSRTFGKRGGMSATDAWNDVRHAAGIRGPDWVKGPFGLQFGWHEASTEAVLEGFLSRGAAARGARGRIDVERAGWGRMVLPVSPGEPFRFFAGRVGTTWGGTEVQSGCNRCTGAVPQTASYFEGLAGAGRAGVDGSVDLELAGREVLRVERRTFQLRRVTDGYRAYALDPFEVLLIEDRVLAFRGAAPAGGGRLPGGVRLRCRYEPPRIEAGLAIVCAKDPEVDGAVPIGGMGWLVPEAAAKDVRTGNRPILLHVNGESVPVRPQGESWLVLETRHSPVRRWDSEGWCGMRVRCPIPDWIYGWEDGTAEGVRADLRTRLCEGVLLFDIDAEIRGEPRDLGRFDPGDGEVGIVRRPMLRFEARALPLGKGGLLAHGAGLALVVVREDVEEELGAHLALTCRYGEGLDAGFLTGTEAGGLLEAGATVLLPSAFETYVSNHEMGQVTTAFLSVKEGVVLAVDDEPEHARILLEIRSSPSWSPYRLQVDVEPDRPASELTTLMVNRRILERIFFLDDEGRLEYVSPSVSSPYEISAERVSAGGAK